MKTVLVLIDGMRPDAMVKIDYANELMKKGSYTLNASTVMPSVTLPCHMSLFHSVDPSTHGTTTNTNAPQVRPIDGLFEAIASAKKRSAFFYSWGPLRDLGAPASTVHSVFRKGAVYGYDKVNDMLTDDAIDFLTKNDADFSFLYLGYVDEAGHAQGWLSDYYMEAMQNSFDNIKRLIDSLNGEYTFIITADHGGHDRMHGTDMPEDMTIPLIVVGKDFEAGKTIENANIKDIAPTVTKLLGVENPPEWEGKSLI